MSRLQALCIALSGLILSLTAGRAMALQFTSSEASMPGAPLGPDPFQIFFDEFGTGFYQVFNPVAGQYGPIVNNPGAVVDGFLRYQLPEAVGLGDVGIAGPREGEICTPSSFSSCSDGLRFILDNGVYYVQFFSDIPLEIDEIPPPLADTGLPGDFAPTAFVDETGVPNVSETFLYAAGPLPHTPANSNFYHGVSDGRLAVPEPATITLLGTALFGFGAALLRRQNTR